MEDQNYLQERLNKLDLDQTSRKPYVKPQLKKHGLWQHITGASLVWPAALPESRENSLV